MNFKIFALFAIVLLAILPFGSSYEGEEPYDGGLSQVASSDGAEESLSGVRKGDNPPWAGDNGEQINLLLIL